MTLSISFITFMLAGHLTITSNAFINSFLIAWWVRFMCFFPYSLADLHTPDQLHFMGYSMRNIHRFKIEEKKKPERIFIRTISNVIKLLLWCRHIKTSGQSSSYIMFRIVFSIKLIEHAFPTQLRPPKRPPPLTATPKLFCFWVDTVYIWTMPYV